MDGSAVLKQYKKSSKNDVNDVETSWDALGGPSMQFLAVQTAQQ